MSPHKGLGAMLKELREARGLTQATLAERAGTTQEYIAMLESGARTNPTMTMLTKLAKALKVKPGKLME